MKKIPFILSAIGLFLMVIGVVLPETKSGAENTVVKHKKHKRSAEKVTMSLEERFIAMKERLTELLRYGKTEEAFKTMNVQKERGSPKTNFIVCFTKKEDGKFIGEVHPKEKWRGDVTPANFSALLPDFFAHAGKEEYRYIYHERENRALVVDLHTINPDIPADKHICAVIEAVKHKRNFFASWRD